MAPKPVSPGEVSQPPQGLVHLKSVGKLRPEPSGVPQLRRPSGTLFLKSWCLRALGVQDARPQEHTGRPPGDGKGCWWLFRGSEGGGAALVAATSRGCHMW